SGCSYAAPARSVLCPRCVLPVHCYCFFFSSRRRHTRSKRDWSSDVCFPISQLTSYRRWLLRHRRDEPMPLVYNDFMNTLMGQPSTQALIPLVKEAGALGLDVFCIDAGWVASPALGDGRAAIGEWNEAKDRFDDGG